MAPLLLAGIMACSGGQGAGGEGRGQARVEPRSIEDVLTAHTDSLMGLPGVVGIGIGLCDGERCITVLLADSSAATRTSIPARLEGYRVVTQVTGPIRPL